jgi:hypothetical protein
MTWSVLFDDQPLRKRDEMEKSAGVFMRPSDIADHTNLAGALEGMLSQQPSRQFKHEPGEVKSAGAAELAIGGLVGGIVGGKATHAVSKSKAAPPPQDVKGIRGRVNKAKYDAAEWARNNPKSAIAGGAVVGAGTGAVMTSNRHISSRIKNILRTVN